MILEPGPKSWEAAPDIPDIQENAGCLWLVESLFEGHNDPDVQPDLLLACDIRAI